MTITPRHSDITALLTATFMVRIFLKRFSSLLTIKKQHGPLYGLYVFTLIHGLIS